jgi:DNA-directed RNA polymerase specialized sigma24 family protein
LAGAKKAEQNGFERNVLGGSSRNRETPLTDFPAESDALVVHLTLQDSEDVIQEVFLALFQYLRSGKSHQNVRGWLFRAAHNLALKSAEGLRYRKIAEVLDVSLGSVSLYLERSLAHIAGAAER